MRSFIFKPEYIYQPHRLLRRLLPFRERAEEYGVHRLPWSRAMLRVREREEHGRILRTLGVVDLTVTEALYRLADPGEAAVDVGANIGYMTTVLVSRLGGQPGGRIWSFEAHPELHAELSFNLHRLAAAYPQVQIDFPHRAVSSHAGSLVLTEPDGFGENRGLATVSRTGNVDEGEGSQVVSCDRLDDLIPPSQHIGVMKLDVEGHEFDVLQGAREFLATGRIRDCVFEEHQTYPSPVAKTFKDFGYTVFALRKSFTRPKLASPASADRVRKKAWVPISFLATRDPQRATLRLAPRGWQCLASRSRAA